MSELIPIMSINRFTSTVRSPNFVHLYGFSVIRPSGFKEPGRVQAKVWAGQECYSGSIRIPLRIR